jgi:hypothetical protein
MQTVSRSMECPCDRLSRTFVLWGDVARVAADYALPCEAVKAAIAYYQRHKNLIDARIAANAV